MGFFFHFYITIENRQIIYSVFKSAFIFLRNEYYLSSYLVSIVVRQNRGPVFSEIRQDQSTLYTSHFTFFEHRILSFPLNENSSDNRYD